MIEDIGLHGLQPADFVDDLLMMRNQRAQLHAAFAVLAELLLRAQQLGIWLQERKPPPVRETLRRSLTAVLAQLRFIVEQLELAGAARHEHINDILGLPRKVWLAGGHRIRGCGGITRDQVASAAEPNPARTYAGNVAGP